ncbi:MAG: cytochrome c, partial [Proteobacteria bacterium]|nr:cytochrome c [Pseudomonadota bacterium]
GSALVRASDTSGLIAILLNGRNAMPGWKQLGDTDLAAVMTYVQNSWSNQADQPIQPAAVVAARAK